MSLPRDCSNSNGRSSTERTEGLRFSGGLPSQPHSPSFDAPNDPVGAASLLTAKSYGSSGNLAASELGSSFGASPNVNRASYFPAGIAPPGVGFEQRVGFEQGGGLEQEAAEDVRAPRKDPDKVPGVLSSDDESWGPGEGSKDGSVSGESGPWTGSLASDDEEEKSGGGKPGKVGKSGGKKRRRFRESRSRFRGTESGVEGDESEIDVDTASLATASSPLPASLTLPDNHLLPDTGSDTMSTDGQEARGSDRLLGRVGRAGVEVLEPLPDVSIDAEEGVLAVGAVDEAAATGPGFAVGGDEGSKGGVPHLVEAVRRGVDALLDVIAGSAAHTSTAAPAGAAALADSVAPAATAGSTDSAAPMSTDSPAPGPTEVTAPADASAPSGTKDEQSQTEEAPPEKETSTLQEERGPKEEFAAAEERGVIDWQGAKPSREMAAGDPEKHAEEPSLITKTVNLASSLVSPVLGAPKESDELKQEGPTEVSESLGPATSASEELNVLPATGPDAAAQGRADKHTEAGPNLQKTTSEILVEETAVETVGMSREGPLPDESVAEKPLNTPKVEDAGLEQIEKERLEQTEKGESGSRTEALQYSDKEGAPEESPPPKVKPPVLSFDDIPVRGVQGIFAERPPVHSPPLESPPAARPSEKKKAEKSPSQSPTQGGPVPESGAARSRTAAQDTAQKQGPKGEGSRRIRSAGGGAPASLGLRAGSSGANLEKAIASMNRRNSMRRSSDRSTATGNSENYEWERSSMGKWACRIFWRGCSEPVCSALHLPFGEVQERSM
jgi:hypothetical protein